MTRPSPGRNPNRVRRLAVAIVAGLGVLALAWFVSTDAFDHWFASEPKVPGAKRPPTAATPQVSDDTKALLQPYLPKAFPWEGQPPAVDAAPLPAAAPDESMMDLLRTLAAGQQTMLGLMEVLIQAHKPPAPPEKPAPAKPVDPLAREKARKAYEERVKAAKEWRLPVTEGTRPEGQALAVKQLKTSYSLAPGTLIPFLTEAKITNDTPGPFRAYVARPVCDSLTHTQVVIPQMAELVLEHSRGAIFGDSRHAVEVKTLTFPRGHGYIEFQGAAVGDREGTPGFGGDVNRHYARIFGSAIFSSTLTAGSSIVALGAEDPLARAGGVVATQTAREGAQQIRQTWRTDPTITTGGAYEGSLLLRQELPLDRPYPDAGPVGCGGGASAG